MFHALIAPLAATVALCLLARREWRREYCPEPGARRESLLHLAGIWLRLAVLWLAVAAVLSALPPLGALLLALVFGLLWAIYETLDLVAWKYLNLSLFRVARHAPVKAGDADAMPNLVNAIRSYVPLAGFARLSGGAMAAMALCAGTQHLGQPGALLALAAALPLGAFGLRAWAARVAAGLPVRAAERAFLTQDDSLPEETLKAADRSHACHPLPGAHAAARHILLVLNESTGEDVTCHSGLPLAEAIRAASGDAAAWLRPTNALTPSSCTDIALPCLFTGCAPQDSAQTLQRLPLLFDLAKARGMTTLFYTASTLKWGDLEALFSSGIDDLATPHSTRLPFVHELGCDDYLMAARLRDRIVTAEGPLFIVLYTYGLHLPFQKDSAGPIPDHITDRRCRAAHTVTEAHRMVFDALRQTGRYDDTLILSLGDHGEAFGVDGSDRSSRSSRLTKLSATVTRPLFLIKPPTTLEPARRACLEANMQHRLVSLIDVAPTLASVLGVGLAPGLPPYSGHDLTRDSVPADRLHITLTVNEWRNWPQAAVMLAQGDLRLCVDYQTTTALTCDSHGQPLPEAQHPAADALLAQAMALPVPRKVIARVFRDKLHNRATLQTGRFAPFTPDLPRPAPMVGETELFFGTDILISDPGAGRLHYAGQRHEAQGFGLRRRDRGILVYGPYIDLPAGRYAASFAFAPGARRKPLLLDVCATGLPTIASRKITRLAEGRLAVIEFTLEAPAEALEVRLHSHQGFSGFCQGLFLSRIG